ncbi:MAG: hypothetical protein PHS49_06660 [Candidatus Gracilibacteria bacterium]|nr:hypothetical protein [Candidatus Gracilibacteria bacterium]
MKKNLKYTIYIIVIIFFIIFLYKKYYLENDNIVKIPPKSFFTQRFVKPAEKPKQTTISTENTGLRVVQNQPQNIIQTSTGTNLDEFQHEDRYVAFNEITDISGYDITKLDNALNDGGRYFEIENLKPFLESKVGDTFSIVLDGYEFKGEVVTADKHIYDQKAILKEHGVPIDENKEYDYGYSVNLKVALSKDDLMSYMMISSTSEGEINGEIEYIPISGYGYKFDYNNGIGVFMTMNDYNKSWGEKYELEDINSVMNSNF